MAVGVGALALVGAVAMGGMAYADTMFPGLGPWAALGAIPMAGAAAMVWALARDRRSAFVGAFAAASVLFVGLAVIWPTDVVDRQKAPRELVRDSGAGDPAQDSRLAVFDWFRPSLVFYTGREVRDLKSIEAAVEFLAIPTPAYLFVPEPVWRAVLAARAPAHCRVAAQAHDFLEGCEIVVVTNVPTP
jgi:hypothetical protein